MIATSLRVRLTVLGLLAIAIVLAIAAVGLSKLFERHVTRRVAAELDAYVRQLAADVSMSADGSLTLAREPTDPRFAEPYGGIYWQIESESGRPLRSRSLWDFRIELPRDELEPGVLHQHRLPGPAGSRLIVSERSVSAAIGSRYVPLRIAAATDEREISASVRAFVRDAGGALLALAGVLGIVFWLQVAIGLRPLTDLRSAVTAVRSGTRSQLALNGPSEVMPLVQEVNALLAERAKAIEAARMQAADLAHGLKTPLTVLATDADRLRAKGEKDIAAEIEELAADMRRHIQYELSRTRIQVTGSTGDQTELGASVDRLVRTIVRTPRGARLAWDIDIPEGLAVRMREDDLMELLGVVLENASTWARSKVLVSVQWADPAAVVIEDDGPGVPDMELPRLGHRGVRLDETSEGTGLGLSIARAIAAKYDGHLQFSRSALGGLKVCIALPLYSTKGLPQEVALREPSS